MEKIITIILCILLVSCSSEKENLEINRVETEVSELKYLFACSDLKVNTSMTYSPKEQYKIITIHLIICDSLNGKPKIDSLKENKILSLSKNAFSKVLEKKQFKYYSIQIYNDYELNEPVKAFNFIYDPLMKDFKLYSNDLIP